MTTPEITALLAKDFDRYPNDGPDRQYYASEWWKPKHGDALEMFMDGPTGKYDEEISALHREMEVLEKDVVALDAEKSGLEAELSNAS